MVGLSLLRRGLESLIWYCGWEWSLLFFAVIKSNKYFSCHLAFRWVVVAPLRYPYVAFRKGVFRLSNRGSRSVLQTKRCRFARFDKKCFFLAWFVLSGCDQYPSFSKMLPEWKSHCFVPPGKDVMTKQTNPSFHATSAWRDAAHRSLAHLNDWENPTIEESHEVSNARVGKHRCMFFHSARGVEFEW